jgi:FAD/FMN-containing dehydrogenase
MTDHSPQCQALTSVLGSKVSSPGSSNYSLSIESYWSNQEREVSPSCILTPQTSEDVSIAVTILNKLSNSTSTCCNFAVRGAGHTPWAGSANIDQGVTIDLSKMKDVQVKESPNGNYNDTESLYTAQIGGGATWGDVYLFLDQLGLSVVGGRVAGVGVGGLLTGGESVSFSTMGAC